MEIKALSGHEDGTCADQFIHRFSLRDDENYFYVACWEYKGSDEVQPELLKEPLVYEAIKVQTRNYKS